VNFRKALSVESFLIKLRFLFIYPIVLLIIISNSLLCKPTISFGLDDFGISSTSIYINDIGITSDKDIAIVDEDNNPDIIICIGNSINCTHTVIVSKMPGINTISVHFDDMGIMCDYNLHITDLALRADIKYAFTDDPLKADIVINLKDSTMELTRKQLIALIDTFAPLFLKRR